MMARSPGKPDPDQAKTPKLPPALARDLKTLYKPPTGVSAEVNDEIFYAASKQVSDSRRALRWGAVAVVAAMILLVLGLEFIMQPLDHWRVGPAVVNEAEPTTPGASRHQLAAAREDIDRSGRIDILDAFTLARSLERGEPIEPAWDVNQDGRVNQADVDAIAGVAVRINGGAS